MIYIAADKHGYKVIRFVEKFLQKSKRAYRNLGVTSDKEDMNFEDMIPAVVAHVRKNKSNRAILSCGTGIGVDIGANRFSGIRSCLATTPQIAKWSRVYDACNVLCFAGWKSSQREVNRILKAWFSAEYDGSKRRLKMFKAFDAWHDK